jgi:hypothetical protein
MRYHLWIVLIGVILQRLPAQVSFECVIDSNQLLIGDQRMLHLQANGSTGFSPDTISFEAWRALGIETLSPQQWQSGGANRYRQMIRITAFDTGYLQLPPLALPYQSDQVKDTVYSNDLALEVNGIMVDSTGLAPIKPILREPFKFRDALPYLIALIVGLILIGVIFLRRKKPVPEPVIVEVPIPPDEVALGDLEKLRGKKLWQQGKIKEYQSELTHIIRAYIENRYDIPALESTTSEILGFPAVNALDPELHQDLDRILNIADLIKFAKAEPELGVHEQFMQKAETFVRRTRNPKPLTDV